MVPTTGSVIPENNQSILSRLTSKDRKTMFMCSFLLRNGFRTTLLSKTTVDTIINEKALLTEVTDPKLATLGWPLWVNGHFRLATLSKTPVFQKTMIQQWPSITTCSAKPTLIWIAVWGKSRKIFSKISQNFQISISKFSKEFFRPIKSREEVRANYHVLLDSEATRWGMMTHDEL